MIDAHNEFTQEEPMTTKLTKMDKVVCRQLAARMTELLKPLAEEFNVQIRLGGGSWGKGRTGYRP
jgi:hypothetical protein